MVSIRIAVFPVWRSPIISSRWPLPIGIMASIALIPVCRGSFTGCLSTMLGVEPSMYLKSSVTIVPFPSIGWPKAFTTRPNKALPTGTCTILPVVFTISPSLILTSVPSRIAPTLSSSRFMAIPYTLSGNSSNSLDIHSSKP